MNTKSGFHCTSRLQQGKLTKYQGRLLAVMCLLLTKAVSVLAEVRVIILNWTGILFKLENNIIIMYNRGKGKGKVLPVLNYNRGT
jgi:hypothetical protein